MDSVDGQPMYYNFARSSTFAIACILLMGSMGLAHELPTISGGHARVDCRSVMLSSPLTLDPILQRIAVYNPVPRQKVRAGPLEVREAGLFVKHGSKIDAPYLISDRYIYLIDMNGNVIASRRTRGVKDHRYVLVTHRSLLNRLRSRLRNRPKIFAAGEFAVTANQVHFIQDKSSTFFFGPQLMIPTSQLAARLKLATEILQSAGFPIGKFTNIREYDPKNARPNPFHLNDAIGAVAANKISRAFDSLVPNGNFIVTIDALVKLAASRPDFNLRTREVLLDLRRDEAMQDRFEAYFITYSTILAAKNETTTDALVSADRQDGTVPILNNYMGFISAVLGEQGVLDYLKIIDSIKIPQNI